MVERLTDQDAALIGLADALERGDLETRRVALEALSRAFVAAIKDDFWETVDVEYDEILHRAQQTLRASGGGGEAQEQVVEAIIYFAERPDLRAKWPNRKAFINAIVLKARSLWLDEVRRWNREISFVPAQLEDSNAANEEDLLTQLALKQTSSEQHYEFTDPALICEQQDVVREALEAMTPRQREVFKLLLRGYTRREIGEMMNITPAAVNKLILRGMKVAQQGPARRAEFSSDDVGRTDSETLSKLRILLQRGGSIKFCMLGYVPIGKPSYMATVIDGALNEYEEFPPDTDPLYLDIEQLTHEVALTGNVNQQWRHRSVDYQLPASLFAVELEKENDWLFNQMLRTLQLRGQKSEVWKYQVGEAEEQAKKHNYRQAYLILRAAIQPILDLGIKRVFGEENGKSNGHKVYNVPTKSKPSTQANMEREHRISALPTEIRELYEHVEGDSRGVSAQEFQDAVNDVLNVEFPSYTGKPGPKSNRFRRIAEIFRDKENEFIPLSEFAVALAPSKSPNAARNYASGEISRLNGLFEKHRKEMEIETITIVGRHRSHSYCRLRKCNRAIVD